MNTAKLILVADDASVEVKRTIPKLLATIEGFKADFVEANNIHEAVQVAWKHRPGSDRPLDLIILDMHMPISEGKSVVENDAGIKVLHLLNVLTGMHLRDRRCPIVVYTAYPSFADCFQCAQAGAAAYVSKVITELPEGKVEGGPQQLVQVCQRLLSPVEREQPRGISTAFSDEWGRINGLWLRKNYGRKWAAFVRTAVAQKAAQEHTWLADRSKYPERDGVVVLLGDTYEEVVTLVLSSPALYQDVPPIIRIPSPEPTGTEVRL